MQSSLIQLLFSLLFLVSFSKGKSANCDQFYAITHFSNLEISNSNSTSKKTLDFEIEEKQEEDFKKTVSSFSKKNKKNKITPFKIIWNSSLGSPLILLFFSVKKNCSHPILEIKFYLFFRSILI